MKIKFFDVWLCEGVLPLKFEWRHGLPNSWSGFPAGRKPRIAVICMTTDCGSVSWHQVDQGEMAYDLVRRRFHHFIGEDPTMTERLWHMMWEVDRIEEVNIRAFGILDMLAWDMKSRLAGMPVYKLLGGNSRKVQAYASTVTFANLAEYERHIKLCMDVGFKAFKLHAWGDVKSDIELAKAVRKWTGPEADLMFDGSAGWDYIDALKVGHALQDEGYSWFEEPMREFHLGSYTKLCEKLDLPILAAETSDGIHWNVASWIEARALDMLRISTVMKGGITGAMKIAHTADSFGMRAQVHGMGPANAILCAAIQNNDYYEQLVINEDQIKALATDARVPVIDGHILVSDTPGFGHEFDREHLDKIAIESLRIDARKN